MFEITSIRSDLKKTIDKLFTQSNNSKIKFIRLASHLDEIDSFLKLVIC